MFYHQPYFLLLFLVTTLCCVPLKRVSSYSDNSMRRRSSSSLNTPTNHTRLRHRLSPSSLTRKNAAAAAAAAALEQNDSGVSVDNNNNNNRRLKKRVQRKKRNNKSMKKTNGKKNKKNKKNIRQYRLWSSRTIYQTVNEWAQQYPDLLSVTTSQEKYGLPTAGTKLDCTFERSQTNAAGCSNLILTLQDFITHPPESETAKRLPTILLNGEVHGDERTGPTSVLETAHLLLEAATCEGLPSTIRTTGDVVVVSKEALVVAAKACRRALKKRGITNDDRKWLARLVASRRIVILPTTNALGYDQTIRWEDGLDPNRDMPYDAVGSETCMNTIAGRTLNEVYRDNLVQLAMSFHGGMEVISYEYTSWYWQGYRSPDETAQNQLAAAHSRFGGGWKESKPYTYGPTNRVIYPVNGADGDWAYAGSWDPDRVTQCLPYKNGNYPVSQTTYNNSTLRSVLIVVEVSNDKTPADRLLGTSEELLKPSGAGTGYISRNIRLALTSIDLVEPYITITSVNDLKLAEDLVPMIDHAMMACQDIQSIAVVPSSSSVVTVQWKVGGAFTVDDTNVWYGLWSDLPDSVLNRDCTVPPNATADIQRLFRTGTLTSASSSGRGQFSEDGQPPTLFSATIDLSVFESTTTAAAGPVAVLVSARVDQNWNRPDFLLQPNNNDIAPRIPPQSHWVNARTNPSWYHESAGRIVEGRLDWFSNPLTIIVQNTVIAQKNAVELSNRLKKRKVQEK